MSVGRTAAQEAQRKTDRLPGRFGVRGPNVSGLLPGPSLAGRSLPESIYPFCRYFLSINQPLVWDDSLQSNGRDLKHDTPAGELSPETIWCPNPLQVHGFEFVPRTTWDPVPARRLKKSERSLNWRRVWR